VCDVILRRDRGLHTVQSHLELTPGRKGSRQLPTNGIPSHNNTGRRLVPCSSDTT